ncbi:TetR/AcrR family transcriptional regulator [Ancylobacter defluvii]|uniref:TetR/AcrR family transcriptional regulator n=1 Tax=Ancylobacter defluvii TaxID=1282440 RepID=UPI001BCCEE48|nr:TetR/AcrR family transcriptional regulator [Ancylobacter defluvii]MBS7586617.1 TetR/AcrR family transcriptional regulator [Ancylobacter defluvii]
MPVKDVDVSESFPASRRADAVKNREHILQIAHDAFAESGLTSLNEIAKRAGIGAGTLYRHFPTREALILAVYQHDIERLVASVPHLLAERTPLEAFRRWFFTLADYVRLKHGLGEALHSPAAQEAIRGSYAPVTSAVETLIRACVADSSMRPGVQAADILLLMGFLWRIAPGPEAGRQAERMMDLVLDGLASPKGTTARAGERQE